MRNFHCSVDDADDILFATTDAANIAITAIVLSALRGSSNRNDARTQKQVYLYPEKMNRWVKRPVSYIILMSVLGIHERD